MLQTSGDLSAWRTLTTTSALTQAASSCGVQDVTAVAYNPSGQPLLGLSCAAPWRSGDSRVDGTAARPTWHDIGPSLGSGAASVIRLVQYARRGRRPGAGAIGDAGVGRRHSGATGRPPNGPDRPRSPFRPAGRSRRPRPAGAPARGSPCCWGRGSRRRVEVVAGPGRLLGHTSAGAAGCQRGVGRRHRGRHLRGDGLAPRRLGMESTARPAGAVPPPSPCRCRTVRRAEPPRCRRGSIVGDTAKRRPAVPFHSRGGTSTCSCRRCGKSHRWVVIAVVVGITYEMGLRWLAHRQTPEHRRQSRRRSLAFYAGLLGLILVASGRLNGGA